MFAYVGQSGPAKNKGSVGQQGPPKARGHPGAAWYHAGMRAYARVMALLVACSSVPAPAMAQALPGTETACPGRVNVIEAVEHPGDLDAAGTGAQRSRWAMHTQSEVTACVDDGTISPAYGYYLGLKIDAQIVRYVFGTSNDPIVRRGTLAAFDRLFVESRPTLLGTVFAEYADELRTALYAHINNSHS